MPERLCVPRELGRVLSTDFLFSSFFLTFLPLSFDETYIMNGKIISFVR